MIEMGRYIETLLLKHDCVIVPGLGGFVAQCVNAYRVEAEHCFYPPYRTVGFNPKLTMNDGLLVQMVMQAHDANFPEALRMIEQEVEQILAKLHDEGYYIFDGIGRLELKLNGAYEFTPHESGVVSPEHYGLPSFTLHTVLQLKARQNELFQNQNEELPEVSVDEEKPQKEKKSRKKEYTITLNRSAVNYVVSAVAALVLYFIFSVPVGSPNVNSMKEISSAKGFVFGMETLNGDMSIVSPTKKVEPVASSSMDSIVAQALRGDYKEDGEEKEATEQVEAKVKTKVEPKAETKEVAVADNNETGYSIVLASAITNKNAEDFVAKLHAKGLIEARVYKRRNMTRVVYSNYPTEEKAQQALNKLRDKDEFETSWIIKVQ